MVSDTLPIQPTVLCVDDDDGIRPLLGIMLRNAGYTVLEAASCAVARRTMATHAPAFAILDVDLTDGNGFELAREWRQAGRANLPILFVSGNDQAECQAQAVQLDAEFLPKPFSPNQFLTAVESLFKPLQPA